MFAARFFRLFWVILIYEVLMLGVTLAMVAGASFAAGNLVTALTATGLAALCGLLCGQAHEAWRRV